MLHYQRVNLLLICYQDEKSFICPFSLYFKVFFYLHMLNLSGLWGTMETMRLLLL